MQLAPIIIFCYKRLDTLQSCIAALQKNRYAQESDLYIFSDAAKGSADAQLVKRVRTYLHTISGFKQIHIEEATVNKGLANSIIAGVSQILKSYETVIVLEDDLVTAPNFLAYMNQSLEWYKKRSKVFSISGYTIPVKVPAAYPYDGYFLPRASSWGWATWRDRWEGVDWDVTHFKQLQANKAERAAFNEGGSDMYAMLEKQMAGKIDSWAIRWCYHQFRQKKYTLYPVISKIKNIGFDGMASHTHVYNRYETPLDDGQNGAFTFSVQVEQQEELLSQFQRFYGIRSRALGKLKTYLYKFNLLNVND